MRYNVRNLVSQTETVPASAGRAVMHFSPNCNDVGAVSAATSVIYPLT